MLVAHDRQNGAEHDGDGGAGQHAGMARDHAVAKGLHGFGEHEIHKAAQDEQPAKHGYDHPPVRLPNIMRVDDRHSGDQRQNPGDENQRAGADELLEQAGIGIAFGQHAHHHADAYDQQHRPHQSRDISRSAHCPLPPGSSPISKTRNGSSPREPCKLCSPGPPAGLVHKARNWS